MTGTGGAAGRAALTADGGGPRKPRARVHSRSLLASVNTTFRISNKQISAGKSLEVNTCPLWSAEEVDGAVFPFRAGSTRLDAVTRLSVRPPAAPTVGLQRAPAHSCLCGPPALSPGSSQGRRLQRDQGSGRSTNTQAESRRRPRAAARQAGRRRAVLKRRAGLERQGDQRPSHGRAQTAAVSPRPHLESPRKPPTEADGFCGGRAGEKRPGSHGDGVGAGPRTRAPKSRSALVIVAWLRGFQTRKQAACLPCPRACSFRYTGRKPPSQPPLIQRGAQPPSVHIHQDPASPRGNLSGNQPVLLGPCAPRPPRAQFPPVPSAESSAQTDSAGRTHASTDPGNDPGPHAATLSRAASPSTPPG